MNERFFARWLASVIQITVPQLYTKIEQNSQNDSIYLVMHLVTLRIKTKQTQFSKYAIQIEIEAVRGNSYDHGYIAVDEFEFIGTKNCQFMPEEAKPEQKTTSVPTPSTPVPTEPPNSKPKICYQKTPSSICLFFSFDRV